MCEYNNKNLKNILGISLIINGISKFEKIL